MSAAPRIAVTDVRAMSGASWLAGGWHFFRKQPLVWIGMCVGWIVTLVVLLVIPFIGGAIASFLQPVFFAGFALTAAKQSRGEAIDMSDLFSGFRTGSVRSLVNLGAILLMIRLAIVALMALGLPAQMSEPGTTPTPESVMQAMEGKWWIILVGMAANVVVSGAFWFAEPLIAFHGLSTAHAVRWSVYAALSNIGAMVVFGIASALMFFLASIPWGLGVFIAGPVLLASNYAGYRAVFGEPVLPRSERPEGPAGEA